MLKKTKQITKFFILKKSITQNVYSEHINDNFENLVLNFRPKNRKLFSKITKKISWREFLSKQWVLLKMFSLTLKTQFSQPCRKKFAEILRHLKPFYKSIFFKKQSPWKKSSGQVKSNFHPPKKTFNRSWKKSWEKEFFSICFQSFRPSGHLQGNFARLGGFFSNFPKCLSS